MSAMGIAAMIAVAIHIVLSAIFRLGPEVAIIIALGLLAAAAIALTVGSVDLANQLGTYFFYFLVASVILLLIHGIIRGRKKNR